MRALPLLFLLALFFSPAQAKAALDFKCDSLKTEDQIGGWLRFDSDSGRGGSVELQYWNGYPPLTIVDAKLDHGSPIGLRDRRFLSEPDSHSGTVAALDIPEGAIALDKFVAEVKLRFKSPENGRLKVTNFSLVCVRH